MSDIKLKYFPDRKEFDIAVNSACTDLELDETFETPVNISLFSDARATPEELPVSYQGDAGGSWMDSLTAKAPPASLLWLLQRAKIIDPETLRSGEDYARNALKWMLDDKIAKDIQVTVTRSGMKGMAWNIVIVMPNDIVYKYKPMTGTGTSGQNIPLPVVPDEPVESPSFWIYDIADYGNW
jgi:phage gp46-like protein